MSTDEIEPPLPLATTPLPEGGLPDLWNDPAWRMAAYLKESFEMVGRLPKRLASETDSVVANACMEAFLLHVRLLSEFLVRRSPGQDFTALDFLWPVPASDAAKRLANEWWEVASKHVVHFSRKRVPEDVRDVDVVEDIVGWLGSAGLDAFAVSEDFIQALERMGHREAVRLRLSLDHNRDILTETLAEPRSKDAAVRMPLPGSPVPTQFQAACQPAARDGRDTL